MLLVSDPIAFCFCNEIVDAVLDATGPTSSGLGTHRLAAIQPEAVLGTACRVDAGLVDRYLPVRYSNEHVISIRGVIPNAATAKTAMV
jgi:hypothetical protein